MSDLIFAEPPGYAQPGKRVRRKRRKSPDPSLRECLECQEFLLIDSFGVINKSGRIDSWCRPCRHARTKLWVADPENKAAVKVAQAAKRRADRDLVLAHYGGVCACCGESQYEFLAIDHINGGGTKHRIGLGTVARGSSFVRWLIKQGLPEGYRVLCHNCNAALGLYGFCPHQKDVLAILAGLC